MVGSEVPRFLADQSGGNREHVASKFLGFLSYVDVVPTLRPWVHKLAELGDGSIVCSSTGGADCPGSSSQHVNNCRRRVLDTALKYLDFLLINPLTRTVKRTGASPSWFTKVKIQRGMSCRMAAHVAASQMMEDEQGSGTRLHRSRQ